MILVHYLVWFCFVTKYLYMHTISSYFLLWLKISTAMWKCKYLCDYKLNYINSWHYGWHHFDCQHYNGIPLIDRLLCTCHYESREGLWLQREAAIETHSFRDAEPQPVIPHNSKKNHEMSLKKRDQTITRQGSPVDCRPSTADAPPIGKIQPISKIAVTFSLLIGFWYPLRFR